MKLIFVIFLQVVIDEDDPSYDEYTQGVQIIMDTLNGIFETYCIYRLKSWINEDISQECGGNENNEEIGLPSLSPENNDNDNDFDLLMPPSPESSECSSPVPEDPDCIVSEELKDDD